MAKAETEQDILAVHAHPSTFNTGIRSSPSRTLAFERVQRVPGPRLPAGDVREEVTTEVTTGLGV